MAAAAAAMRLYVGTYTEPIRFGTGQVLQGQGRGIHLLELDAAAGTLKETWVAEGVRNPSYLVLDRDCRHLYCVNELKTHEDQPGGAVSAFRVDPVTGRLAYLNTQPTGGTDPCHLALSPCGRCLLVANFGTGSVGVLPVRPDGALDPPSQLVQHEGSSMDPARQAGPHAHAVTVTPDGRFVLVPDLGLDQVLVYRLDAAAARIVPNPAQPSVAVKPGAGPRQMALHPDGRSAYLINELDSTVQAFAFDGRDGVLKSVGTWPTLPPGFDGRSTCAELQIAPTGRFLYGSNRGHDSIATFAVNPDDGLLTPTGHVLTGGRIPRHFAVAPGGELLVAANQDSGTVIAFRLDGMTGQPERLGAAANVGTPVCVVCVPDGRG